MRRLPISCMENAAAAAPAGGSSSFGGVEKELHDVAGAIDEVEREITALTEKTEAGEQAFEAGKSFKGLGGEKLLGYLDSVREKEKQLREKERQLREKEKQLREKEAKLMDKQRQVMLPPVKRVRTGAEFDADTGGFLRSPTWADQLAPQRLRRAQLPQNIVQLRQLVMSRTDICIPLLPRLYRELAGDVRQSLPKHLLVEGDESTPCTRLSNLVEEDVLLGSTEIPTTINMGRFISVVFDVLSVSSGLSFPYEVDFNSTETGTSGTVILKRKRPDTLIVVNSCSLLFGEDKAPRNLMGAVADLRSKVTRVSIHHYGDVRFLLEYAASGTLVEFYAVFDGQQLASISDTFDMARTTGRIELICTLAQVYGLLHLMARCLPLADRTAIFQEMQRPDDCSVMVTSDRVVKVIRSFPTFAAKYGVSLPTIQAAYRAACASSGETWLIQCVEVPNVKRDVYSVETVPVGYLPPEKYSDVRAIAWGCCKALCVLHAKGLVHRDIRPENMLCRAPGKWTLIDLELVTNAGTTVQHAPLRDWDEGTLENGVYTIMSDMYQVGCMVERLLKGSSSAVGAEPNMERTCRFVADLKLRRLTAEQAVQHDWFTAGNPP